MAEDGAMHDEPEQPVERTHPADRRRHQRVQLGGSALLFVDPRRGLIGAKGNLVDLSEGGCRLRFRRHVDGDLAGRVRLNIAGKALWFPVVTRHVVADRDGWTVGCAFVGLTPKKQERLRALLFELSVERGRGPA
jgi:hypothetical protein